ncbi:MAG: CBS domain-containing protein [Deltaproteobacteria bacterium]|nr:CBS domain-containing protein [Deltaproteobacteria bacterium]
MEATSSFNFGVVDQRFLARSLGLLNPPPPVEIHHEGSIRSAVELLKANKIGAVIVTDAKGSIVGMFTERDVVTKISLTSIDLEQTPISEVMTKNPQTAQMTTTVAFALNMMSQGGYRHIPIIDDGGTPVGMISVKNIVDYIASALTKDLFKFEASKPA